MQKDIAVLMHLMERNKVAGAPSGLHHGREQNRPETINNQVPERPSRDNIPIARELAAKDLQVRSRVPNFHRLS